MSINPKAVRRTIVDMIFRGQAGHLGSSLSMVEILLAIYESVDLPKIASKAPDRDRVIISKGHGAAATYAVLHHLGLISKTSIDSYHTDGTRLGGHISHLVEGIEHSTGAALGHGLPVAVGIAIGAKTQKFRSRVFCVIGDGELQEGVHWEALYLANKHQLGNLVVIIDNNKISSIGPTKDVGDATVFLPSVGWYTQADGHDIDELKAIIRSPHPTLPTIIDAHTIKGKGVSFAENIPRWHYANLDAKTYEQAHADLA